MEPGSVRGTTGLPHWVHLPYTLLPASRRHSVWKQCNTVKAAPVCFSPPAAQSIKWLIFLLLLLRLRIKPSSSSSAPLSRFWNQNWWKMKKKRRNVKGSVVLLDCLLLFIALPQQWNHRNHWCITIIIVIFTPWISSRTTNQQQTTTPSISFFFSTYLLSFVLSFSFLTTRCSISHLFSLSLSFSFCSCCFSFVEMQKNCAQITTAVVEEEEDISL